MEGRFPTRRVAFSIFCNLIDDYSSIFMSMYAGGEATVSVLKYSEFCILSSVFSSLCCYSEFIKIISHFFIVA